MRRRTRQLLHSFTIALLVALGAVFPLSDTNLVSAVAAAGPSVPAAPGSGVVFVPGTVAIGADVENALRSVLAAAAGSLPQSNYYAVSDVYQAGEWYFVSVAGLNKVGADLSWSLMDDGNWFGVVLLKREESGDWSGAAEGTAAYSTLLAQVPGSVLGPAARQSLDPRQRARAEMVTTYHFPWTPGTNMVYGSLGLHTAGFLGWTGSPGWKAVDFLSNGNTSQGYAPNRLLAAAGGTISAVCNDGTSAAIRIGDLLYVHLLYTSSLHTGRTVTQGEELGQLRSGDFSASCGWATQGAGWFHVHWCFPASAPLQVEDWTLSMSDGLWRRGSEARGTGSSFEAAGEQLPDGNLSAPSAGQVVTGTVHLQGWASTPDAGLEAAHFTVGWDGQWQPVGPDYTTSPFAYDWDVCQAGVPDGDVELGLVITDTLGHTVTSPQGTRHVTKSYDCASSLSAPVPVSPTAQSLLAAAVDLKFAWLPVQSATEYLVEWWGGPHAAAGPCGWRAATQCHVGAAAPGQPYYWHVKARNAEGESAWSPTWSFGVDPVQVVGSPAFSASSVPAGRLAAASFALKNLGWQSLVLRRLTVATYGPNCAAADCPDWTAFPYDTDVTLPAGQVYTYTQQRTLSLPGTYLAKPTYRDEQGAWHTELAGSRQISLTVTPGLAVTQRLAASSTQIEALEPVTMSFTVKNSSQEALALRGLGVLLQGTGCQSDRCASVAAPALENVALGAGQPVTFSSRLVLSTLGGTYRALPGLMDPDGHWMRIAGSTPLTVTVQPKPGTTYLYLPVTQTADGGQK